MKKAQINIRGPKWVRDELKIQALRRDQTLEAYAMEILTKAVQRRMDKA